MSEEREESTPSSSRCMFTKEEETSGVRDDRMLAKKMTDRPDSPQEQGLVITLPPRSCCCWLRLMR